jgi:malonyl CoA-acyl carrier protein transacylase
LTGAVRFSSSIASLPSEDVSYIEMGPGGVLAGLIKRITGGTACRSVGQPEDL